MKNSVMSMLIACFILGGVAWRVHYRRAHRGDRGGKVVNVFKFVSPCFNCR